jgi:hypothetical protein
VTGRALACAVASVVGLTAGATSARADRQIVGILEVRVDGVSSTAAEKFETSIEEGLGSTDYWVATRKRMREILHRSSWSEGCLFGPCLAEVKKQTGASLVVVAYFEAVGSSYRFVVTLVDTATGVPTAQVADHCDVCTLTEALDSAALATIGLVHGANEPGALPVRPITGPRTTAPPTEHHGRTLRRTALLLLGGAAIAGGSAAYFMHADKRELGYSAAGAAGGLGVAGLAVLGISFRF